MASFLAIGGWNLSKPADVFNKEGNLSKVDVRIVSHRELADRVENSGMLLEREGAMRTEVSQGQPASKALKIARGCLEHRSKAVHCAMPLGRFRRTSALG